LEFFNEFPIKQNEKNDGAYTFDFKFYFKNEKALHKLKKQLIKNKV